jgi:hypothetical protein
MEGPGILKKRNPMTDPAQPFRDVLQQGRRGQLSDGDDLRLRHAHFSSNCAIA